MRPTPPRLNSLFATPLVVRSDPVAYRIEPLLLSPTDNVPPPMYLTVPGQDVRLHVKAKQLGDVVFKSFFDGAKRGTTGATTTTATAASRWGSLAGSFGRQIGDASSLSGKDGSSRTASAAHFALGGQTGRVDYCLQPGLIENEYIR
jgi:hypothetical protein